MANCTVGTTDSSSIGNIMYFEIPNCTIQFINYSSNIVKIKSNVLIPYKYNYNFIQ